MLKKDLQDLNMTYKEIIEDLKQRNERLELQVDRLQDALICTRAPEAYRDMKADENDYPDMDPAVTSKMQQRAEIEAEYLRRAEMPLFESGDEIAGMLEESLLSAGITLGDNSLHDNSES